MLRPGGFTLVTDLDGKVHEGETFQCKHCGAHTHIKPFQRAEDLGGHCRICDGLLCARCAATGLCDPLERKLARATEDGLMAAMGTAEIDFGAFPGSSHATVAVSGQAAIVLTSLVEAWIYPKATTDHSADEHLLETLKVAAQDIVAGVGFTIAAVNTSQLNEALLPLRGRGPTSISPNPTLSGALQSAGGLQMRTKGGNGTRLYGKFTVAWAWGDP